MSPGVLLAPQPAPTGEGPSVTDWVLSLQQLSPELRDLVEVRRIQGTARYGTELRARNGRDALADQMQEAVDGLLYAATEVLDTLGADRRAWRRFHTWRGLVEGLLDDAADTVPEMWREVA